MATTGDLRKRFLCAFVVAASVLSAALPSAAQTPSPATARLEGVADVKSVHSKEVFKFTPNCSTGPCDTTLAPQASANYITKQFTAEFDGSGYSASYQRRMCLDGESGNAVEGELTSFEAPVTFRLSFTVTKGVLSSGVWRAKEISGSWAASVGRSTAFKEGCDTWVDENRRGTLFGVFASVLEDKPTPSPSPRVTPRPTPSRPAPGTVSPSPSPSPGVVEVPLGQSELPELEGNVFVASVRDPTNADLQGDRLLLNALLTLLLILLLPFPAELFNSTYENNHDEIRGWIGLRPKDPARGATRIRGWIAFIPFTVIAAFLNGFLDPGFGVNRPSLITLISLAATIVVLTFVFVLPSKVLLGMLGWRSRFDVLPGSILIAVVCVVASRVLSLAPGYLYGLVAGLVMISETPEKEEGQGYAFSFLWLIIVAGLSWAALVPVNAAVEAGNNEDWNLVLQTVLAATFTGGLSAVAFGLAPLKFLPGEKVLRWSKVAWALLFGSGVFALLHFVLNPTAGNEDSSVLTATIMFGVFGLISVAFWSYFRFRPARESES
ncbi:MAG TPA: FGLLP motif-containing membrane protein [Actinomycetota bacterium]|nr:FGLLP motif-containing membrane protein [Actinomycetota bacterium]